MINRDVILEIVQGSWRGLCAFDNVYNVMRDVFFLYFNVSKLSLINDSVSNIMCHTFHNTQYTNTGCFKTKMIHVEMKNGGGVLKSLG